MTLATRCGLDSAGGGVIAAAGNVFVTIDGLPWAVVGDPVATHGSGPHTSATMSTGSAVVSIDGLPACRAGDLATCTHAATGSGHVQTTP